jgi:hypothetical protein
MARNKETPLHFDLPDDDSVDLITWEFVLMKLDEEMASALNHLNGSTNQLTRISERIQEWLDEQAD